MKAPYHYWKIAIRCILWPILVPVCPIVAVVELIVEFVRYGLSGDLLAQISWVPQIWIAPFCAHFWQVPEPRERMHTSD